MPHYYINSDGNVYASYNQHWHETSWTINISKRYNKNFGKDADADFPENNQKLDNFLKTFVKE